MKAEISNQQWAEKMALFMGWRPITAGELSPDASLHPNMILQYEVNDGVRIGGAYWNPIEEIADAWKIVGRLRELGFLVAIRDDSTAKIVWCDIFRQDFPTKKLETRAFGEKASQAICYAVYNMDVRFWKR